MAIAIVKSKLATASATTVTATFASGSAAANNLLLAIHSSASTAAVTTPTGYTLIDGPRTANGNKQSNVYVKKAAGGETAVTVTQPNARGNVELIEISGMSVADIDAIIALTLSIQAATSNSGATTVSTRTWPSVDPTQTGEVLMVAFATLAGTPGSNPTWDNSYATTEDPSALAGCRQWSGTKVGTNLGAQAPTATWTTAQQSLEVHFVLPAGGTNTTVTPSAVSAPAAVPPATIPAIPPVVSAPAAVPTPTVQTATVVLPGTVSAPAAMDPMGAEVSDTATPDPVAAPVVVPVSTEQTGAGVSPTSISAPASIPAPVIQRTPVPASVPATTAVPTPTVTAGVSGGGETAYAWVS